LGHGPSKGHFQLYPETKVERDRSIAVKSGKRQNTCMTVSRETRLP